MVVIGDFDRSRRCISVYNQVEIDEEVENEAQSWKRLENKVLAKKQKMGKNHEFLKKNNIFSPKNILFSTKLYSDGNYDIFTK